MGTRTVPDFLIETHSAGETRALGRGIGQALAPGMVLGLIGPLGAGKTTLVQGIAQGMRVRRVQVASPTFILAREYPGRIPLYHLDLYRLDRPLADLHELGYEEYLDGKGAAVIEWADRAKALWPNRLIAVQLQVVSPTTRRLTFEAHTKETQAWLKAFVRHALDRRRNGRSRRAASSTGRRRARSRSA